MTDIHIPKNAPSETSWDEPATERQIAHMRDLGWPMLDPDVTIGQAAAFINHVYHLLRWSEGPA